MCGRYVLYTEKEAMEINEIIHEVERKLNVESKIKTGEIFPTDLAPVLVEEASHVVPTLMSWGFPNFKNKGVMINARVETAKEKPSFKDAVISRRCVIPSSGFFEWDKVSGKKQKDKYLFTIENRSILYMAGLYNSYKIDGNITNRFVILTTQANESMVKIHDRMPLVLMDTQVKEWLFDRTSAQHILRMTPPNLVNKLV